MFPIQYSTSSSAPRTKPSEQDTAPPARSGLALPYLDHVGLRAIAGCSKLDRSRLEQRLASKQAKELMMVIAGLGGDAPLYDAFFIRLAKSISALDERVAAPLWRHLENRFIELVHNDIDIYADAEKGALLEKLIRLSAQSFPNESHSRVLAACNHAVNTSFNDPDAVCTALTSLFAHCRALPLAYRAVPLQGLMLSLPTNAADGMKPQIAHLIVAMKRECLLLPANQQAAIDHAQSQSNSTMENFFASFGRVCELPAQERQAGLATLIKHMLTIEHNDADTAIGSTLRMFAAQPQLLGAEMLTDLIPSIATIAHAGNRAQRVQTIVHLSTAFAADKRVPLLKNLIRVAETLPEADRKKALFGLYRATLDMNQPDQVDAIRDINFLGASLPATLFAQVLVTMPIDLQHTVRTTMLA